MRPVGPTVTIVPGMNKPPAAFEEDRAVCRQFADRQVVGGGQTANNRAEEPYDLMGAVGADVRASTGNGRGAELESQAQYDITYSQCMFARGNRAPEPQ
jgi:hypothetical protein